MSLRLSSFDFFWANNYFILLFYPLITLFYSFLLIVLDNNLYHQMMAF